jgi:hypothetical protein
MERLILPEVNDHLRYALQWCHCPENSLEDPQAGYAANWFVQFLLTRFSEQLIRDIWQTSTEMEGPLQALNRLLEPEEESSQDYLPVKRLFRQYCVESYIDQIALREVFERFGPRSVADSLSLQPDAQACSEVAFLEPLSCHYYRLAAGEENRLRVAVEVTSPEHVDWVHGIVFDASQPRVRETLAQTEPKTLRGKIDLAGSGSDCHAVLMMANDAVRDPHQLGGRDARTASYRVSLQAG